MLRILLENRLKFYRKLLKILQKTIKNPNRKLLKITIENCKKSYRKLLKILQKTVKNPIENC